MSASADGREGGVWGMGLGNEWCFLCVSVELGSVFSAHRGPSVGKKTRYKH